MENLTDIISYLVGAGGVILFVLAWIRFRHRDSAATNKINAESLKVKAEAQEIRAKADVLITDGALRIVDRLSADLDEARDEIEKLLKVSAKISELYEKSKIDHKKEIEGLNHQLKYSKDLLETKKRHCIDTRARVKQLQDLLKLKQEGLTQVQLEEFISKLNELINSAPLITPTNLSS